MKSISVVINARLGSTRVKNKLIRPFAGRSLIDIALEKLNNMDFFENRYLAVAEDELKDYARKYENVKILERDPISVKRGVNPQNITFAHFLRVPSDYIFVFNPCLPCIKVSTIKEAYDYICKKNFKTYTAAVKTGEWIFDNEGNALTNSDPSNVTTNKDISFYKATHAFHVIDKNFFKKNGYLWSFKKNDPHLIEMPEDEAIDVDTEIEFDYAEFVYKKRIG